MPRKKTPPAPEPAHACGHPLWIHSKKTNAEPWRCHESGCDCRTTTLTTETSPA